MKLSELQSVKFVFENECSYAVKVAIAEFASTQDRQCGCSWGTYGSSF